MGQLKHYNPITQEWEPTIAGAQGPQGAQGADGYVGADGESGIVAQSTAPEVTDILWLDTDEEGVGIPLGGTAGQVLSKVDSGDFNTGWTTPLSQNDIDTALEDYYTSSQVDTTLQSYYTTSQTDSAISTAVSNVIDTAPAVLDTLNELSASLNDDPNFATTVANALAALVPAGTINQTARATAPSGYLLCDGSAVSRTTYSALFDAIGTAYGSGDGSTTFNIPNLKGRVPVGYDPSQTEFDALGETGGAKTHTLSINEMPSHTHVQDSHNHTQNSHNHIQDAHVHSGTPIQGQITVNGGSSYGVWGQYGLQNSGSTTATNQPATATNNPTTATNQNTGGGQAHNNLQPYVVLNYMIKI